MTMNLLRCKQYFIGLSLILVFVLPVNGQQLSPDAKLKLVKVNFSGLQKQQPQAMIDLSGLRIGQMIDLAAIRAATQMLSDSGLFKKITVRYEYTGDTIELIFNAEEAAQQKAVCLFENFVWFTDDEIKEAIKIDLPEFDGTAASDNFTVSVIKKSLMSLLQKRKLAGEVSYETGFSASAGISPHVFSVKAPNLDVCAVQFDGLKASLKKELNEAAQLHLNQPYARSDSNTFMRVALIPIYENNGYLKVKFAPVKARPSGASECKGAGIVVVLPIEEGLQYRWDKAVWTGNKVFSAKDFDTQLKIKTGEVANADRIKESLAYVKGIPGSRGYLDAQFSPNPLFDDATQRVTYQVTVDEGPQYRAGQLTLTGFTDNEAKSWQGRWRLKTGEVFNTSILAQFMHDLKEANPTKDFDVTYKRDKAALIADVVVSVQK